MLRMLVRATALSALQLSEAIMQDEKQSEPSPSASAPDGVRAAAEEIAERVNWSRDTRMSADFLEETIRKHLTAQGRPGPSQTLQQAAEWFQQYADGHIAKGDTEKAARNQSRANTCRAALTATPSPVEGCWARGMEDAAKIVEADGELGEMLAADIRKRIAAAGPAPQEEKK